MKRLWAPWRLEYVQHADDGGECVFCRAAGLPEDEPELVIHRGELAFVLLNKFPYASGHLMVAPYRHGSGFDELEEAEARSFLCSADCYPVASMDKRFDHKEKVRLWHRRLGHAGVDRLRQTIKAVEGVDLDPDDIQR